jgi:predicted ATPase
VPAYVEHDLLMATVHKTPTAGGPLLERGDAMAALHGAHSEARAGHGTLMLVAGEAGSGKTALLRAFCAHVRSSSRTLEGMCDPLSAPRPLGPFVDIAAEVGGALAELVQQGARPHDLLAAIRSEVQIPTVLVLEDVHWADGATLDVLRILGRRIKTVPALIIASYRDDLERTNPLRIVLGELATVPGVSRIKLEPLSASAVAELAEGMTSTRRSCTGGPLAIRSTSTR